MEIYQWNGLFLMEDFAWNGKKGHEVKKLNECHMFPDVVNLSKIASVDGKFIK
jgi:hypothetical protein